MQKNVTKQKKNTLNILLRYGVQFLSVELWKIMENVRIILKYLLKIQDSFNPSITVFPFEKNNNEITMAVVFFTKSMKQNLYWIPPRKLFIYFLYEKVWSEFKVNILLFQ